MNGLTKLAESWAAWMVPALLASTATILVALLLHRLLIRHAPPSLLGILWWLVFSRLILPTSIGWTGSPLARVFGTSASGAEAAPIAAAAASTTSASWLPLLFSAWLVGILCLAARVGWRARRGRAWLARSVPVDPVVARRARTLAGRLGLRSAPPVRAMAGLTSPAVWGVVRPVVLLPDDLVPEHLDAALAHELAHVARRDLIAARLWALAHLLFWFQPLLIVARRRADAVRELACDRAAVRALEPAARSTYRRTLLQTAARIHGLYPETAGAALVGRRESVLLHRLRRLETLPKAPTPRSRLALVTAALALAMVLLPARPPRGRVASPAGVELAAARESAVAAIAGDSSLQLRYAVMRLAAAEAAGALETETDRPGGSAP